MTDSEIESEWKRFAGSIKGKTDETQGNYFRTANSYKIVSENSQVELNWGTRPERGKNAVSYRTLFLFSLKNKTKIRFTLQPRHFLMSLIHIFSSKEKFGIAKLDKAFILVSNKKELATKLKSEIEELYEKMPNKYFVITIDIADDIPQLSIDFPEMLTSYDDLKRCYEIGMKMAGKISVAI